MLSVWFPILSGIGAGAILLWMVKWQQKTQVNAILTYRNRYSQLVSYYEHLTLAANELGNFAENIKDPQVLKGYQQCLDHLEKLLKTMRKVQPFGKDPSALNTAYFVTNDLRKRMYQVQRSFKERVPDRPPGSSFPTDWSPGQRSHCYFCSRPQLGQEAKDFGSAKIKLHGKDLNVLGCKTCCEELKTTGKVRVLFFRQDGQPVHWQQVKDYEPIEEYWSLNDGKKKGRVTHLELVRNDQNPTNV